MPKRVFALAGYGALGFVWWMIFGLMLVLLCIDDSIFGSKESDCFFKRLEMACAGGIAFCLLSVSMAMCFLKPDGLKLASAS